MYEVRLVVESQQGKGGVVAVWKVKVLPRTFEV